MANSTGSTAFAKRDYLGLICTGAVNQILQPFSLQAKTDCEHDIRVRYLGNVARSRLE